MTALVAYPPNPAADGTALLVFSGPPGVSVQWSLAGPGALTPRGAVTDARGLAGCVFTPVAAGDAVIVSVTHGV